jgi:hypothetical protein
VVPSDPLQQHYLSLPFVLPFSVTDFPSSEFRSSEVVRRHLDESSAANVLDFGGLEAGETSGSSTPTGGTTTVVGTDKSAVTVGAAAGAVMGEAETWLGRARRAAFAASVTAFMYMSA